MCKKVSPHKKSTEEGTIFTGNIAEITYLSEGFGSEKDSLYLEIFDNIELPYNTITTVKKNVAGKESTSMSRDVLKFSANGIEFEMKKERDSLVLEAESTGPLFVPYFETRVIEALQFVISRPLDWYIMIKQLNGNTLTCIRERHPDILKYKVLPPIDLSFGNHDEFCEIFRRYLEYVLQFQENENKYHPISGEMRDICQASIGNIETMSLILAVAVESILKHVHETKFQISPEENRWIKKASDYFDSWSGPKDLSERIKGLFSMLSNPSPSMRLKELVELGAITDGQRKAWTKCRNKYAHGEGIGSASLQESFDLYYTVLVLFYHLVFFAIGYRGKYSDYSTKDWPTNDYSVTPLPLPAEDTT